MSRIRRLLSKPSARVLFCLVLCASHYPAIGHTLPIGFLRVVPDADYVHMELVLNPFELRFFSELDHNRNGRLEPMELQGKEKLISQRLVSCLKLKVDDVAIPAETSGLVDDFDTHHLTVRAHYAAATQRSSITIESSLPTITSGSHITQVTFGTRDRIQSAQLGMNSTAATFDPIEPLESTSNHSIPAPVASLQTNRLIFILISLIAVSGALAGLFKLTRLKTEN